MRPRWQVVLGLTAVWLLLWGSITPMLVVGGLVTSYVVLMLFPFPKAPWRWTPRPWGTLVLVSKFLFDLVVASIEVAWLAVRPAAPPQSAVLKIDLIARSEILLTATSELVSLVPGSLLIDLDAEIPAIYIHVLDGSTPERIQRAIRSVRAQERRVVEAWAPREEREAYRRLTREEVSS